jgi:hypothetical protein
MLSEKIKNNSKRSKKLLSIFQVFYGMSFIQVFFGFYRYKVWSNHGFDPILDSWDGKYNYLDVNQFDMIYGLFAIFFLVILIITGIRFIQWFRRAYCNLNRVGINTDKKEGWAAGSWFIPFYNLFAPQQIMKEIWNKTQKYYKETTEDENMVNHWWLLWVLCFILDNQSDGIGSSFFGDDLEAQAIISICSNILWIPLTYTVVKLVKKVSSFEKEMYEKSILEDENSVEELNEVVI